MSMQQGTLGQFPEKLSQARHVGLLVAKKRVVVGATNRQQGPGFIRGREYCFAVVERDDFIVATVNYQYRAPNVPDVITRRVTKTAQPACR